ncbi:MAG: host-nuclease inhibitor Gam family protein [Niallia sp.]
MSEINRELEEIMNEEETFTPFVVSDLETASEANRRIAYFEEKKQEIDKVVESQLEPFLNKIKTLEEHVQRLKEWGEKEKEPLTEKQSYYANMLQYYLSEEIEKQVASGKKPKKTLSLPYGKISFKKQQPEFIKDDDTLLEYAKANNLISTVVKTDWASIKKQAQIHNGKLYDPNGEVIPGVEVVERPDKFELKLT